MGNTDYVLQAGDIELRYVKDRKKITKELLTVDLPNIERTLTIN